VDASPIGDAVSTGVDPILVVLGDLLGVDFIEYVMQVSKHLGALLCTMRLHGLGGYSSYAVVLDGDIDVWVVLFYCELYFVGRLPIIDAMLYGILYMYLQLHDEYRAAQELLWQVGLYIKCDARETYFLDIDVVIDK
jgi:hypothetical protein